MKNLYWFVLLLLGGCAHMDVISTSRSADGLTFTTIKATIKGDYDIRVWADVITALNHGVPYHVTRPEYTPKKVRFTPVRDNGSLTGWRFE